jgi:hypothetical protein
MTKGRVVMARGRGSRKELVRLGDETKKTRLVAEVRQIARIVTT